MGQTNPVTLMLNGLVCFVTLLEVFMDLLYITVNYCICVLMISSAVQRTVDDCLDSDEHLLDRMA